MWFRKNTWNRILNTIWVAPRKVWTKVNFFIDAAKTALYWVLDTAEWIGKTATSIKEAVNKACSQWRRYNKLRKIPTSIISSPLMAIEWVWETLFYTWWNILRNTRDTIANPFTNAGRFLRAIWSKRPIWEFSFAKVKATNNITPANLFANSNIWSK